MYVRESYAHESSNKPGTIASRRRMIFLFRQKFSLTMTLSADSLLELLSFCRRVPRGRKLLTGDRRNSSSLVGLVLSPHSDLMFSQCCATRVRARRGGKTLNQNHCSRFRAERCAREGNFAKCVGISGSPLSV